MADLVFTQCEPVKVVMQFTGPAVEAILEGQRCRFDAATGQIALGNGTNAAEIAPGGIALHAAAIGEALTIVNQGIVDVGAVAAWEALNFNDPIYVSDTDGRFGGDAGDSTVDTIVGRVVPGWNATTAEKLLSLNGL
jgi:hypothetical protein